ncbi:MAG: hypothetical protein A3F18_03260 [Legionellales bacterium RIFCSPHIGHO2_12_FULL_37_14]|nr:MAG: hypothetical protein A3F18_03260 [Legionellales bacterium RIFCSPHIGHO2_12_FULL_37_14]
MLTQDKIESLLKEDKDVANAIVTGDGYHFDAIIVSDAFAGLSRVARQQKVYAKLNAWIKSGELHAISLKTYTKQEWEKQKVG